MLFLAAPVRVDLVKATAAAEKRAIAELRRRSHAEGGMAFKVRIACVARRVGYVLR